jgi:hypothetical protein
MYENSSAGDGTDEHESDESESINSFNVLRCLADFRKNKYFILPLGAFQESLTYLREDNDDVFTKYGKTKTVLLDDKNQLMYSINFDKKNGVNQNTEFQKIKSFITYFLETLKENKLANKNAFICNNNGDFGYDMIRSLPGSKKQLWHSDFADDTDSIVPTFGASILINCDETLLEFRINKSVEKPRGEEIIVPSKHLIYYEKSIWHWFPPNKSDSVTTRLFFYVDPYKGYRVSQMNKLFYYNEKSVKNQNSNQVIKNSQRKKHKIVNDETASTKLELKDMKSNLESVVKKQKKLQGEFDLLKTQLYDQLNIDL